ncbi:hypothetical protein GO755_34990 [Spirosoma sp. HMF4905]|uniref:Uncharacterized protein n=1 Tax=Spirosoma arboris TaxID=2682092 RepID=A0A7K1SNC4_9BACT|nr:hypothetical protein [Spirosoma arboris]MVM35281.1 hypothetical protein [Spirosoma arboris]
MGANLFRSQINKERLELISVLLGILSTISAGVYFLYINLKAEPDLKILSAEVVYVKSYPVVKMIIQNTSSSPQFINNVEYELNNSNYKHYDVEPLGEPVQVKYNWLISKDDLSLKKSRKTLKKIIIKDEICEISFIVGFKELRYKVNMDGYFRINYGEDKYIRTKDRFKLTVDNELFNYPVLDLPRSEDSLMVMLKNTDDEYSRITLINEISERNILQYYNYIDYDLKSKDLSILLAALQYIKNNPRKDYLNKIINLSMSIESAQVKQKAFDIMRIYPSESIQILDKLDQNELTRFYKSSLLQHTK